MSSRSLPLLPLSVPIFNDPAIVSFKKASLPTTASQISPHSADSQPWIATYFPRTSTHPGHLTPKSSLQPQRRDASIQISNANTRFSAISESNIPILSSSKAPTIPKVLPRKPSVKPGIVGDGSIWLTTNNAETHDTRSSSRKCRPGLTKNNGAHFQQQRYTRGDGWRQTPILERDEFFQPYDSQKERQKGPTSG